MPKLAQELKAIEVARLNQAGFHAVGGVSGLYLSVSDNNPEARSWIVRTKVGNKRREIGLGAYPAISLAQARQKATETKEVIKEGVDPVEQKRSAKSLLIASQAKEMIFEVAALRYLEAKSGEWKNAKHALQWQTTLQNYAFPLIGQMQLRHIELAHIQLVLDPIWTTRTETASRLRGRLEKILDWASVKGLRTGENPARWKGNLDHVYAAPNKIKNETHHAALHYDEINGFMTKLAEIEGSAAHCLRFAILTASRSGEVRGALWNEIDLNAKTWTIPKERMKAATAHTIPLSAQAIAVLEKQDKQEDQTLIFPAPRGKALSDMAMSMLVRRLKVPVTVHGFRSTFRDWAANCTSFDRATCEHALAHKLPDKVEAAYQRSTLLPKRAKLMQAWADRCDTPDTQSAVILPMRKKA